MAWSVVEYFELMYSTATILRNFIKIIQQAIVRVKL